MVSGRLSMAGGAVRRFARRGSGGYRGLAPRPAICEIVTLLRE